jgi:hypothetical protein
LRATKPVSFSAAALDRKEAGVYLSKHAAAKGPSYRYGSRCPYARSCSSTGSTSCALPPRSCAPEDRGSHPLFNPAMVLFDDIVQLLDRIRTRRGTVPIDFSSAIALCDAAYGSSVTTRGVPLFFIALRKKRFAAATSRRSLNRKSMVRPCLSTALYKYVHRPFTFI